MRFWDNLAAVVLDMDGVVFIGKSLRQGINTLLARLDQRGVQYHILTNTSASSSQDISAQLAKMGLVVEPERITTSSELAANFVRSRCNVDTVFTLGGGNGLASALEARGVHQLALENLSMADAGQMGSVQGTPSYPLLIGWTRIYDYDLAAKALVLEKRISGVYSTGADRSYAVESGVVPGIRWVSGSIGALLEKEPVNLGKPNPYTLDYVLGKLQQSPASTVIIGDSISDIQIGNEAGCRTILVLGGATPGSALDVLEGSSIPGAVIAELTELL